MCLGPDAEIHKMFLFLIGNSWLGICCPKYVISEDFKTAQQNVEYELWKHNNLKNLARVQSRSTLKWKNMYISVIKRNSLSEKINNSVAF